MVQSARDVHLFWHLKISFPFIIAAIKKTSCSRPNFISQYFMCIREKKMCIISHFLRLAYAFIHLVGVLSARERSINVVIAKCSAKIYALSKQFSGSVFSGFRGIYNRYRKESCCVAFSVES